MRMNVFRAVAIVLLVAGAGALATGSQRPDGCVPCGNDFKKVQPSSCGIAEDPVAAYRANGDFVAIYSNRCFACTANGVFCTVSDTQ